MKLNKYFPFAGLYFFINSVALPFGLTYTALLGPFFYGWILLKRKKEIFLPFITLLLPFIILHIFVVGVDLQSYAFSMLNIILVYFFGQAFYTFLKVASEPEKIFRKILFFNFLLCLVALVFYFTPYAGVFWIEQNLTDGVSGFRRLKLLTYEASYYAVLFVPIFVFYLLQYMLRQNKIPGSLLLFMLFLPLALSFSVGVIGALLLSGLLVFILYFRRLVSKKRILNAIISVSFFSCICLLVLFLFFRDNPFFSRMINIIAGEDTSGQGRTSDAFMLAEKLLKEKNEYWGIGAGQIKIIGQDMIRGYYLYSPGTPVAIPNAAAETLTLFGWVGLALRLFLEVFLFFYTRVWRNYYRLLLFLFMFVYQFTGSFITNAAEYVIWILAFTPVFHQFDVEENGRPASAVHNR